MTTSFEELGLCPQLVQAVTDLGYRNPTPIQSAIIPRMLEGGDVIGQAQTGTGKTAAFGLPILQNLTGRQKHVRALILSPTRELAIQVADSLGSYGRHCRVRVMPVYGGQSYSTQIRGVKQGKDIIVGTPGRLLDLINRKVLDLGHVETVVLDEADEMLSMGFIEDIESILNCTSPNRQTALFSATMPGEIRRLAGKYMATPETVTVKSNQLTAELVEQRYVLVNEQDKLSALTRIFEVEAVSRALVFVGTRAGTGELAAALEERGFPAEALNGDLSQNLREQVVNRFRRNQITTLVATDVAARGLDIDDISHVFNYDPPQDPELYVHRIGRTARAGKTGIAISLLTPRDRWQLNRIAKYTKQRLTRISVPTEEEILARRRSLLIDQFEVWLKRKRCNQEKEIVAKLTEAGYDLNDIAAVAIKLSSVNAKQRPILPISELCEARTAKLKRPVGKRSDKRTAGKEGRGRSGAAVEKGMVRLSISAGKTHGVRPSDIVGAIAYHGNFPGSVIGAIRIMEDRTLVDVPQQFVPQALAKAEKYRFGKRPVTMEIA
jgi:ATP-dependent RNA helicase DeaD